jgi:DNA-binding MarR family transcriptional regulator
MRMIRTPVIDAVERWDKHRDTSRRSRPAAANLHLIGMLPIIPRRATTPNGDHRMSLDLFYSRAGHLIRRMNQISVAIFLEETRALGLTTVQYAALNMIDEVPNIDQARLSSMIAFDTTTLVKVLDRLAEKGLITRTRSQTDRRKQLLNATAQGCEVVRKIQPMIDRAEQRILAPLSPSDRRKFMETLTQLVNVNNVYSRAPLDSELLFGLIGRRKKSTATATKKRARARSERSRRQPCVRSDG